MKKILLLSIFLLTPLLFAQPPGGNIQKALGSLEDTTRSMMIISVMVEAVIAVLLLGIAILIYLKKLKGVEKKEMLWIVVAAFLGLAGLFFLFGAFLGFVAYLTTPTLVRTVMGT